MEIKHYESVIEALLFAAGDIVPLEKIAELIEVDKKTTRLILENMIINFKNSGRGIMVREIDGGYQLCTKPQHYEQLKKYFEPRQRQGLSQAAFETLAIIAYNQPITRAKVEQVRGVNSDSAFIRLVERNLIKEAGRMDSPGKPILYETTEEFLRAFGYKSIKDMPRLEMNEIETVS